MSSGLSPPKPLRVCSDKQCSTLVDNVLSRYACKQCCDVQHVGLGHVGSPSWLATSVSLCLPSLCSGRVPEVSGSYCTCVPERFSLAWGSQTTCWHVCQTLNSETKIWFSCFSLNVNHFMYHFYVECQWGTSRNCFNLNFNWSNQIDLWMQQSIYDTVAFWLKMCGNFRAPTLPGTPHKISIF